MKLPPITVIMKIYMAMEEVLIIVGVRSTIVAEATPTHISPMILEGIKERKHHGLGRTNAPAANGAAASYK